MKRILLAIILCVGVVSAQSVGSLVWNPNGSNVTVNAPTNAGTLIYALPGKSGTLALTSDTPPPANTVSGSITLANGTGTATIPLATVRCIVSDPSGNSVKYAKVAGTLTVNGVGPVIDFACF